MKKFIVQLLVAVIMSAALMFPLKIIWNGFIVSAFTFTKPVDLLQCWGLIFFIVYLTPPIVKVYRNAM